jgi:hypothetical protein
MITITPKTTAGRCATACVLEGAKVTRLMEPITGKAGTPSVLGEHPVPVTTSMKMVCAQAGTYSSLHVSVTTTSLHPHGDLTARQAVVDADIEWSLDAFDKHAAKFNSVRHALGQSGEWKPSGR